MPRALTRIPPLAKIVIGVVALVAVGLVLKAAISPGPSPRCVFSCANPPTATPLQAQGRFSSAKFGFSFIYPSAGQRIKLGGRGITGYNFNDASGNFLGQIFVAAGSGHQPPSYLVDTEARSLGDSEITNMHLSVPMLGAEIGFEPGVGNLYTGEFTDSVGDVYPVQVGVLAVQHGDEWVYMVGVGTVQGSSQAPPIFSVFDGILDGWRWVS